MVGVLPFRRTGLLVSDIGEFFDKVSEAVVVLERTFVQELGKSADHHLEGRHEKIRCKFCPCSYSF